MARRSSKPSLKSTAAHRKPSLAPCPRCGGAACLKGKSCPAYGKKYTHCGKLNHFQKVCQSAKSTPADSVDNVMHVDALGLTLQPTHAASTMLQVTINGNEATMEVDTGAAVTLISEPMWHDLGSPTFQSSGKVFTAYDGHRMKPLGEFKCRLAHLQSTVNATVTVIQSCKRYGLLGRDLFESFFPSVSLSAINSHCAVMPATNEGSTSLGGCCRCCSAQILQGPTGSSSFRRQSQGLPGDFGTSRHHHACFLQSLCLACGMGAKARQVSAHVCGLQGPCQQGNQERRVPPPCHRNNLRWFVWCN